MLPSPASLLSFGMSPTLNFDHLSACQDATDTFDYSDLFLTRWANDRWLKYKDTSISPSLSSLLSSPSLLSSSSLSAEG